MITVAEKKRKLKGQEKTTKNCGGVQIIKSRAEEIVVHCYHKMIKFRVKARNS